MYNVLNSVFMFVCVCAYVYIYIYIVLARGKGFLHKTMRIFREVIDTCSYIDVYLST